MSPDDLEEAERRHGVQVRSGDAVLLRTGYGRAHEAGAAKLATIGRLGEPVPA